MFGVGGLLAHRRLDDRVYDHACAADHLAPLRTFWSVTSR
jgi:hypothetical protein